MDKCKFLLSGLGMAAVSVMMTGCAMCTDPIPGDDACVEKSHDVSIKVLPDNVSYSQPMSIPSTDVFKPSFEAGKSRVSVIGTGSSLEEATSDAVSKFMEKTNCDYIVGTTRVISTKTHPTNRWSATTNYTVRLAGIPVTLTKLEKVTPKKPAPAPAPAPAPSLTKEDVQKIVASVIAKQPKPEVKCPFGTVKLTDINVSVNAKAVAEDPAGLVFPAKKAK